MNSLDREIGINESGYLSSDVRRYIHSHPNLVPMLKSLSRDPPIKTASACFSQSTTLPRFSGFARQPGNRLLLLLDLRGALVLGAEEISEDAPPVEGVNRTVRNLDFAEPWKFKSAFEQISDISESFRLLISEMTITALLTVKKPGDFFEKIPCDLNFGFCAFPGVYLLGPSAAETETETENLILKLQKTKPFTAVKGKPPRMTAADAQAGLRAVVGAAARVAVVAGIELGGLGVVDLRDLEISEFKGSADLLAILKRRQNEDLIVVKGDSFSENSWRISEKAGNLLILRN